MAYLKEHSHHLLRMENGRQDGSNIAINCCVDFFFLRGYFLLIIISWSGIFRLANRSVASVALNDLACLPQVEAATNLIYAQVRDKLLYYNNKRSFMVLYATTGIITVFMIEKQ